MNTCQRLLLIFSFLYSSSGMALSPSELGALRTEVIEICRGGTSSGFSIDTQTRTQQSTVTFNNFSNAGKNITVVVNKEQWQGIKALASDPKSYSQCVEFALATLTPLVETTISIDRDINARLSYLQSNEFCDRLKHVIVKAPDNFAVLKIGTPKRTGSGGVSWNIGPYIMANPEALGYSSDNDDITILRNADISTTSKNLTTFSEPIFFTHFLQVNNQASYLFDRLEKIVDSCISYKAFRSVKDVSYSGISRFGDGDPYWTFDVRRGFLKAVSGSFIMTINQQQIDYLGTPSTYIWLTVYGAEK